MAYPDRMYLVGCVKSSPLNSSDQPTNFVDLGETPGLSISFEVTKAIAESTCTQLKTKVASALTGLIPSGNLIIKSSKKKALEIQLFGETVNQTTTAETFTNEPFISGVIVNDTQLLPNNRSDVSALVIKDSAGSPATLTAGTDYTANLVSGEIKFLNLGTYVQPFTASGSQKAAMDAVSIATKEPDPVALLFDGIDIFDGDVHKRVLLYKVQFAPPSEFAFKGTGDTDAEVTIPFELLALQTAPFAGLGPYGNIQGRLMN